MNEINEIAKRSAVERLKKAMELEKIGPSETARKLNILPTYISMALNEKSWDKLSKVAWDRLLFWCNSGETIHHFKIPIGEAIIEERKKKPITAITNSHLPAYKDPPPIPDKITAPLAVEKLPFNQDFTDTAKLKVCLDIEINLVVNGQKVQVK